MDRSRLAIVIPAWNEASSIAEVVTAACAYGSVVVVDDCSSDDTGEQAAAAGAMVVHHQENRGYDGALESGFAKAREMGAIAVVTMDADNEHDPRNLEIFSRLLVDEGVPMVLGYRPRKQRLSEVVMGFWFLLFFGVRDILCGMKGYQIDLYRDNDGFDHVGSIGTELACFGLRRRVAFQQVPVAGRRRLDTPRFGAGLRANGKILAAMFRVLWRRVPDAT